MKIALRSSAVSIYLLFTFCACQQHKEQIIHTQGYKFEISGLHFGLDSTSISSSSRFQVFTPNGSEKEYLAFLNPITSSINIYDLKNPKHSEKTIKFEIGIGPNSIGGSLSFFEILNKDSILTLADFSGGLMTLTDWQGSKINSFDMPIDELLETNYYPGFSSAAPVFQVSKDALLFPYSISRIEHAQAKPPVFQLDMRSGVLKYGLTHTALYHDKPINKIGGKEFFKASMTYNPDQNVYVLTFPLDDRVFSISPDMQLLRVDTLPDPDFKPFQLLERAAKTYKSDEKRYLYHRYGNSRYASIIYDRWRKVYYRVLVQGLEKSQIKGIIDEGIWVSIPFKVSVYDQNFNKLLDHEVINETISFDEFFVSSQGLNFKEQLVLNEDLMSFKTLKLVKSEGTKKP